MSVWSPMEDPGLSGAGAQLSELWSESCDSQISAGSKSPQLSVPLWLLPVTWQSTHGWSC